MDENKEIIEVKEVENEENKDNKDLKKKIIVGGSIVVGTILTIFGIKKMKSKKIKQNTVIDLIEDVID